jgi:hypothetical protein
MHSTLTNSVCKGFLIVLVLGLELVGEVSAPTGGPLKRGFGSNGDFWLASRFFSGKFSASKSATTLSSLPPDAQRPIAAALGRDNPTYWLHQNPQGFRGENLQHAASPGTLFWILTNGVVRRGMPVWSKLPEPQRWQIVTFVKSLTPSAAAEPAFEHDHAH